MGQPQCGGQQCGTGCCSRPQTSGGDIRPKAPVLYPVSNLAQQRNSRDRNLVNEPEGAKSEDKKEAVDEDKPLQVKVTDVGGAKEVETDERIDGPLPEPTETPPVVDTGAAEGSGPSSEMVVEIAKTEGERLGVDVDWADGITLRISGLRNGIIANWNKENPNQKLEIDDVIMAVNGTTGDSKALLEEIVKADKLLLKIKKKPEMESHVN
mmetsp:Transcript_151330/g.263797  ORF Transcript_151330/g.263797 Transcript_151330/m.263797 type:complete len:210 (-) Transcript_151330:38-667(-)